MNEKKTILIIIIIKKKKGNLKYELFIYCLIKLIG